MGDNTEQQKKKRKSKWTTSYSNTSIPDAQERLGLRFRSFGSQAIPVVSMLDKARGGIEGLGMDDIQKVQEKVYDHMHVGPSYGVRSGL